jgi:hypothetical protein
VGGDHPGECRSSTIGTLGLIPDDWPWYRGVTAEKAVKVVMSTTVFALYYPGSAYVEVSHPTYR